MTWYRVEDRTAGQVVLVESNSPHGAVRKYNDRWPPDLMISKASNDDIAAWTTAGEGCQPWPL
ncbi:Uncharacterised protein [Mycobacteroides abscessus subsp. abscessus]|uniref:hypothetical protein n=1 Tax=Mycobacteroides abscessus TaxID=36809 RepID=UPI000926FADA|nr:hypothetical protein [Mycobacteroides abscessus]SHZ39786.1 Uncharacterised protein [Mycobacteroides abscessus subsp. abscessus]SHZ41624.1 Uncharacterised protein [Mycobacteroides abscessus subsp. abscessus]